MNAYGVWAGLGVCAARGIPTSKPHASPKVANKLQRGIYDYVKTGSVWEDQLMWVTDESTETIEEFVAGFRPS